MDLLFYERNKVRYATDIPAFVQLSFWNPFKVKQAKILDFSLGGFRLEFLESFALREIDSFWLIIPLENFQIEHVKKIKLRAEVKWQDPLHRQVGGIYPVDNPEHKIIVEKLLLTLDQRKK
jgi:hypothetical protein